MRSRGDALLLTPRRRQRAALLALESLHCCFVLFIQTSMSDTSPARKRARTQEDIDASSNPAHPNIERVRDEEFWYEDGNIIIVTSNVEFKVFRGILMDHSPIFKDMLSLPQPSSCDPSSIPVVPVDDSPQDLRHVFGAIMPKSNSMKYVQASMYLRYPYPKETAARRLAQKTPPSTKCLR